MDLSVDRDALTVHIPSLDHIGAVMDILGVDLTISGMNCNPEMEATPVRDFLLGLKWMSSLLVWNLEVGRHLWSRSLFCVFV